MQDDIGSFLSMSVDKIRSLADAETVIGTPVLTSGGLTVIPVSRVSMGLATGGLTQKETREKISSPFRAGGGTGLNVTPVAFLMISPDGKYELLSVKNPNMIDPVSHVTDLIEHSPDLIKRLKQVLSH